MLINTFIHNVPTMLHGHIPRSFQIQYIRHYNQIVCINGFALRFFYLTRWGRVTHICVSKLITIGSDNGLSPERRHANIWTIAEILLIGNLRKNQSNLKRNSYNFIQEDAFENVVCERAAILSRLQCAKIAFAACTYIQTPRWKYLQPVDK